MQTFARGQGYAVTIKSSIAGKRVYLNCDRGALNVNKLRKEHQRQTSSRRIGCPFLLSGIFKATSLFEDAQAYIKKFLQTSTGDLLLVLYKLTVALENQVRTEETRCSEEKLRYLNELPSIFTPVCEMVSAFAIKKWLEEIKRKTEERGGCTMVFTSTMGIPYAHKLK